MSYMTHIRCALHVNAYESLVLTHSSANVEVELRDRLSHDQKWRHEPQLRSIPSLGVKEGLGCVFSVPQ